MGSRVTAIGAAAAPVAVGPGADDAALPAAGGALAAVDGVVVCGSTRADTWLATVLPFATSATAAVSPLLRVRNVHVPAPTSMRPAAIAPIVPHLTQGAGTGRP